MTERYDGLEFSSVKSQVSRYASFQLGHRTVEQAMPVFSRLEVQRQLQRLSQAMDLTNKYGPLPFGGIFDVTAAVQTAQRDGVLTPDELVSVAQQSYGIRQIQQYMEQAEGDHDQVGDLTDALDPCTPVANAINRCIDASGQVLDNASAKLAAIRRQIKQLQERIASMMRHFMSTNGAYLQDDIVAQRNGRAVVLINNSYKNTVGGLQYGSSQSGQAVYVEPTEMVGPNNDLANAQDQERQEIARILLMLSQLVKEHAAGYLANLQTLGLLDALFAKAQWGRDRQAVVGGISEHYDLMIEKGRHPLIDPSRVVANSYHIVAPVRTVLITGPNTGGKTVSLKLIGLFVVLQLAGFPLPCASASIPVYDQLFYDIGDEQSIQADLSTFSAHITKLAQIIKQATSHSLVLLDELGSGTDPAEGQALASAVLDHFRRQQVYLVATTHYGKLKSYAHQFDDVLLASVEFDTADLRPTYRYLEGMVGQSNAFDIALRCGFDPQIVAAARQFKQSQQTVQDGLTEKLQAQLAVNQRLAEKLASQQTQVELEKAHLVRQDADMQAQREQIMLEARRQAAEAVAQAQEKADDIIDHLKKQERYRQKDIIQLQHKLDEIAPEPEPADVGDNKPLEVGDWARVALSNQVGQIIELDKKNATVDCAGVRFRTSLSGLTRAPQPKRQAASPVVYRRAGASFSPEINLVGQHVEDGLALLDKYLDDAVVARAPYVRIIHGMGTGVLRQAIWERLKSYRFVDHYEMAPANQGGAGATLVTLREHER